MSCDELFHRRASRVNRGGTPTVTLLISTVVAMLFIVSAKFSRDPRRPGLFLRRELFDGLHLGYRPAQARAGFAAALSRLGLSLDHATGAAGSIAFLVGAIISDKKNSLMALAILAAQLFPSIYWSNVVSCASDATECAYDVDCIAGCTAMLFSHVSSKLICESGGIGRRARLRIWYRKVWGFESPLSHQMRAVSSSSSQRSADRLRAQAVADY